MSGTEGEEPMRHVHRGLGALVMDFVFQERLHRADGQSPETVALDDEPLGEGDHGQVEVLQQITAVEGGRAGPRGRGRFGQTALERVDIDIHGVEIEGYGVVRHSHWIAGAGERPVQGRERIGKGFRVPGPSAWRSTGGRRAPPGRWPLVGASAR
jgi:hypothetical protein